MRSTKRWRPSSGRSYHSRRPSEIWKKHSWCVGVAEPRERRSRREPPLMLMHSSRSGGDESSMGITVSTLAGLDFGGRCDFGAMRIGRIGFRCF